MNNNIAWPNSFQGAQNVNSANKVGLPKNIYILIILELGEYEQETCIKQLRENDYY